MPRKDGTECSHQKDAGAVSIHRRQVFVFAFNVVFLTLMGSIATSAAGWSRLVLLFAAPLTVLGMMRFFVVKETHDVDVESKEEKLVLRDVFRMLKKDPFIFIIAITNLVFNMITNMGVGVYFFTDIVGNVGLMGMTAIAQVVALPMMFILPGLIKKSSAIRVMQDGVLIMVLGYVINFFAGSNLVLLMIGSILVGGGSVPLSM